MTPRSATVAVLACTAVLFLSASPAHAVDNVTVADTTVNADRGDNDDLTATVHVVNNGNATDIKPADMVTKPSDCSVTILNTHLPERQGTDVKLALGATCLERNTSSEVVVDLDGSEDLPLVTVKSPSRVVSPWLALWAGLGAAAAGFLAFLVCGFLIHWRVRKAKVPDDGLGDSDHARARADAHAKVRELVQGRWEQIWAPQPSPPQELRWAPLTPRRYKASDRVLGLEAGWSLKDSSMASLTALISAVVAVASSSQLFTAMNQDPPKGPLAVMAVAGLIGVGLVAVANTAAKLIGKPVNEVTVKGIIICSAALFAAAAFEIVAVIIAAGTAFNVWSGSPHPLDPNGPKADLTTRSGWGLLVRALWGPATLFVVAVLLGVLAWWYLSENLRHALNNGVPVSGVATLPMAEFATWVVPPGDGPDGTRAEKQLLLEQRIRTALGPWLLWEERNQAVTRVGEPWSATGVSYGEDRWGPGGDRQSAEKETTTGSGEKVGREEKREPEESRDLTEMRRQWQQELTARPTRMALP